MSYSILKNISVKKRSITSAESNVRPIIYETWHVNCESEEKFIKDVLISFLDGSMQSTGTNCWRFRYAIIAYKKKHQEEYEKLYGECYGDSRTHDSYLRAIEELRSALYAEYKGIIPTMGDYVIKYSYGYVYSIMRRTGTIRYGSIAKHFRCKEEAIVYARQIYGYEDRFTIINLNDNNKGE